MNIALFHTTLPEPGRKPGGVEVAVHRLANELDRTPDDAVTVFSLTPCPEGATYEHVQLFAQQRRLRENRVLRLFLLPLLLNKVSFKGFDVLHLHGDDWFFVRRILPTVRTLHGSALEEARTATSLKRRLSQYCVYPLEHLSARLATVPLAVGLRTRAIYGLDHLADNGVDMQRFRPGPKAERPRVLFVGTWEGRKRGRFLFEAFTREVLPRVPEAELYMVSDFCPEHENVTFIHYPDDDALAQLYRSAWVFAYPSVYEGFGIPYVEAMASGTAVLTSANDGAKHVLAEGTYGVVTSDEVFGARLAGLLEDGPGRRRLEKQGLQRAKAFTWKAVAAQHREAYQQAMAVWGQQPDMASANRALPQNGASKQLFDQAEQCVRTTY